MAKISQPVHRTLNCTEAKKRYRKKDYLNQWMALGMSVFGIPIGIIFSLAFGNFAYIGIPIGMSLGMAIGASKDQEVAKENRQLPLEYFI
ncbi:hypothetical protein [Robertkochia aurantiaca]|uniref:hypothetical protein n=1 Tax=Robertkochia aurantiaca TaxID=2873700 RepID=UPI001CCCBA73|nr:hypothetical protein [Robertkochia sp. 3YJGBD-33]